MFGVGDAFTKDCGCDRGACFCGDDEPIKTQAEKIKEKISSSFDYIDTLQKDLDKVEAKLIKLQGSFNKQVAKEVATKEKYLKSYYDKITKEKLDENSRIVELRKKVDEILSPLNQEKKWNIVELMYEIDDGTYILELLKRAVNEPDFLSGGGS